MAAVFWAAIHARTVISREQSRLYANTMISIGKAKSILKGAAAAAPLEVSGFPSVTRNSSDGYRALRWKTVSPLQAEHHAFGARRVIWETTGRVTGTRSGRVARYGIEGKGNEGHAQEARNGRDRLARTLNWNRGRAQYK